MIWSGLLSVYSKAQESRLAFYCITNVEVAIPPGVGRLALAVGDARLLERPHALGGVVDMLASPTAMQPSCGRPRREPTVHDMQDAFGYERHLVGHRVTRCGQCVGDDDGAVL